MLSRYLLICVHLSREGIELKGAAFGLSAQVDRSVEINRLLLVMTCITRSGGEQKSSQHLHVSLIKRAEENNQDESLEQRHQKLHEISHFYS